MTLTPDKAREIIKDWNHDRMAKTLQQLADLLAAEAFLEGVAYREEQVRGLVEALEHAATCEAKDIDCIRSWATKALAAFKKPDEGKGER